MVENNIREALAVVYTDKPVEKIELEREERRNRRTSETVITDYTEAFKEMARKQRYAFSLHSL